MSWDDQTVRWMLKPVLLAAVLLAVVAAPALADDGQQTTLLLTPSGQPVGGSWQQWMNDSYMPTYNGSMVLDLNSGAMAGCGQFTDACTANRAFTADVVPALSNDAETVLGLSLIRGDDGTGRQSLLYEQAHVIDLAYLTDDERVEFSTLWGKPVPAGESVDTYWWAGEDEFTADPNVTVVGEWFADDYSLCALHRTWSWKLLDRMGGLWPGGGDDFPIYQDFRQWALYEGHYVLVPPTRAQSHWLRTQRESCPLIRGWISQATPPPPSQAG